MQVGQFLRLNPELRKRVQVLTKITISEEDTGRLSRDMIEYVSFKPPISFYSASVPHCRCMAGIEA